MGNSSQYRFVELAARPEPARMIRRHFVPIDDVETIARWRSSHGNCDIFASVCRFPQPQRGADYVCPFFLDIDAEGELETARRETLLACDLLGERLGVLPVSLDIFFSGRKGFHVLVPPEVFQAPGTPDLIEIWRGLANRIAQRGVAHLDRGVYDSSRLLRMPNSVHSNTGLHKVALDHVELAEADSREIHEIARTPRGLRSMADPTPIAKAVEWFQEAAAWRAQQRRIRRAAPATRSAVSGWRTPPCIRRIEIGVLPDGCRHSTYYTLARFYAMTGMSPQEALRRLADIDVRHPIRDPDYLQRVVASAWKKPGFWGCPNPSLEAYCDPQSCHLMIRATASGYARPNGPNGVS